MGLTNWFQLSLILCLAWAGIAFSRYLFKRRFNPLSLYTAIWALCLGAYELHLIRYYDLSWMAWLAIVGAWASMFMGAVFVVLLSKKESPTPPVNMLRLKRGIFWLCVIGSLAVLDQILVLASQFGNLFTAVFVSANDIYSARINNDWSTLPYVSACLFAACPLAGMYTAIRGKFTLLGLAPCALIVAWSVFSMSRGGLLVAVLLFVIGFLYTPRGVEFNRKHRKWAIVSVLALTFSGFLFVSFFRGLGSVGEGETGTLQSLDEVAPVFSSAYLDLSGGPVAFDQYLRSSEKPQSWFGMYTFAPLFRVLSKFGISPSVPSYEEYYEIPADMNLMTYLKNLHSDFGPLGILLGPFALGMLSAWLCRRPKTPGTVLGLSFLCSLLAFSFMFSLTILGFWYIALIVGLLSAAWIQRRPWPRLVHNPILPARLPGG